MKQNIFVYNNSNKRVSIGKFIFKSFQFTPIEIETTSLIFREIRKHKNFYIGTKEYVKNRAKEGGYKPMLVSIMNKAHWTINIDKYIFKPYKETTINVGTNDYIFRLIRSNKNLRVGKHNNEDYIKKNKLVSGKKYNFIYDIISQHAGAAYKYAIEALANPIFDEFKSEDAGFFNRPVPGPRERGINCRFFNSSRINQQGKCPVGPNDVFISHGIGDKNYWIGKRIDEFKYAFCPGPVWEKRMRNTGYIGEIFITGYTKLDPIFQGKYEKTKREKPYIAWLPTHGYANKHKGRSSYPFFQKYLKEIPHIYEVGNGMHPTTKMHSKKKQVPTIQELVDADVVIADAGSTVYEAWAVGKPVIFPDWICKKDIMDHFKPDNLEYQIYVKQIGYHAKNMKELISLIDVALSNGMKDEEKAFIESIFPKKLRGVSGKTAAKALIEIRRHLK